MRIISGKYKGRKILAPKNLPIRPTTDMAKESLFNILNNLYYFDAVSVLDLFSGSGNISYEFGSRGTENIHAVDNNLKCIRFINQTANDFDLNIQTYKSNVYSFLEKTPLTFDIIFADPPYDFNEKEFTNIADIVFDRSLLNENGILVIEHSKHTNLSNHTKHSYLKSYGGCVFSFFE